MKKSIVVTITVLVLASLSTGCSTTSKTTNTADKLAVLETTFEKNSREIEQAEKVLCHADMSAVLARYKTESARLAYIKLCQYKEGHHG
jgi:hypothetical protein